MLRLPPGSTLFPYTTLFRSMLAAALAFAAAGKAAAEERGKTAVLEYRSGVERAKEDRKSTRLNSSHEWISYAVFCLKKKKRKRFNIIKRLSMEARTHRMQSR